MIEELAGTLREIGRAQEQPPPPRAQRRTSPRCRADEGGGSLGRIEHTCASRQNDTCTALSAKTPRKQYSLQSGSTTRSRSFRGFSMRARRPVALEAGRLREEDARRRADVPRPLGLTTGDACGSNMMTCNSYALNMGYVMQQAPVKPERAILEANMGGRARSRPSSSSVRPRQDGARRGDARRRDRPPRAPDDRRRPARPLLGGERTARSRRGCPSRSPRPQ